MSREKVKDREMSRLDFLPCLTGNKGREEAEQLVMEAAKGMPYRPGSISIAVLTIQPNVMNESIEIEPGHISIQCLVSV
jgi:hypothetical protein